MAKADLKDQVLLAALECSRGDPDRTFTSEELLIAAWKREPRSWGLRGFEKEYPDSHRIHRELDSRGKHQKGLVDVGLLRKVKPRVYRMTPKGLAAASALRPTDAVLADKTSRVLADEIERILEHPSFKKWLDDRSNPDRFREAGHFWSVAPGTPARVIRERIAHVDQTLRAALDFLRERDTDEAADGRGMILYERMDIERCIEFQNTLKQRFAKDLHMLRATPD